MSSKPAPPRQVPTLTEVVQFAEMASAPVVEESASAQATVAVAGAPHPSASLPLTTEEQIAQRVLADLQRQIDLMLEHRLRELLAPAVARMADQLVRDTRTELASTLRDVIAKAVAQELARFRGR
jgi:hypothetical protein